MVNMAKAKRTRQLMVRALVDGLAFARRFAMAPS
jgi:hypothetical protein